MKYKIGNVFKGDRRIWWIFVIFSLISLVAVYSSIGWTSIKRHHSPTFDLLNHALFVLLSYVAIIIVANINRKWITKAIPIVYLLSVFLAFVTCIQGTRWLNIVGVSFQPSELAKLAVVLFTARMVSLYPDQKDDKRFFWILIGLIGGLAMLILPQNFSSALLVGLLGMAVLLFGGINTSRCIKFILAILGVGALVLGIAYLRYRSVVNYSDSSELNVEDVPDTKVLPRLITWGHRIDTRFHPNYDEVTQENKARMAIAQGGFIRFGIGSNVQSRLMTQAHNDFIYAIIIEETGMVGGIVIFLLYCCFYFCCLRVSARCKDAFGSMIVFGLGSLIFFQALIHMLVVLGVGPTTGQNLPLISSGGSAYVIMAIAIGIIQSIASDNKIKDAQGITNGNS